jgi:hypothetical protein
LRCDEDSIGKAVVMLENKHTEHGMMQSSRHEASRKKEKKQAEGW